MQFTISVYDENDKCKVCGSHVSERHEDGCEVGALRKELVAAQQSVQADKCCLCGKKKGKAKICSSCLDDIIV